MVVYELRFFKDADREGRVWCPTREKAKRLKNDLTAIRVQFPDTEVIRRHYLLNGQAGLINFLNENCDHGPAFPVGSLKAQRGKLE